MKPAAIICVVLLLLIIIGLGQTALNPKDFSGEWYSADNQSVYLFQEGLIFCQKHTVALSDTDTISGAYVYCKKSILLFADGIEALESEKDLYLIKRDGASFLCENEDGFGRVYFIRYND